MDGGTKDATKTVERVPVGNHQGLSPVLNIDLLIF